MPRKKVSETAPEAVEPTNAPETKATPQTDAAAAPKPRRRTKAAETPAPVEEIATPKSRPRRTKAVPEPAPEPATVAKAPVKPAARSRKAVPAEVTVGAAAETPAPIKKTKSARRTKAEPEATAPSSVPDLDLGDETLIVTFRPRGTALEPSLDAPVAAEESGPKRRRRRRGKGGSDSPNDTPPGSIVRPPMGPVPDAVAFDYERDEDDLPIPSWRPVTDRPAAAATGEDSDVSEDGTSEEPNLAPRRSRRRRRGKGEAEVVVTTSAEGDDAPEAVVPAMAPKPPAPPSRPAIVIPADAPQVVLRDGIPTLVRDGVVYPPMVFFGSSPSERAAANVLEELKMAGEFGIHLHSHMIELEVEPEIVADSVAHAAFMLARSVEADPKAQVIFRVTFLAGRNWAERYPDAVFRQADGTIAEPSVSDDRFWGVAERCLKSFVQQLRKLPLADQVLGVHLERGEWFFADGAGYDTSNAAKHKFRDWARTRYQNDEVTLRASWFDGQVRFDNIQVPPYQPEGSEGEKFVRSSRKQRRYVDYHLFLSDATVHRLGELAYAVKEASEGRFLVGASYGYTFEWSHPASGHLSLGKLLRTPEIDFIAGPPSYRDREPGGTAPFPGPIDSFALNGKLYLSEEDFKTSIGADGREPDDFNPTIRTPQALESVHWRGAGAALAHAGGVSWMDLWGNGWLKTHSIWERGGKIRDLLIQRMGAPLANPDVTVFIDERALAYLVDPHAFELLVQNVRESVLRSGMSCGFYLLSDLAHREKFPESRLYLFLNAWDIRPELRAAIKTRLQRDRKVLVWLYAAGLFDSGRDSLERAREVTGIALKPQPFYSKSGTTILNRRHPLCSAFSDKPMIGGAKLEPSYFAIPEEATVLGEYTQTGLPSFLVKEFSGDRSDLAWTSVFLGEPTVNAALIRALGQMAGAHVWNFHEDVVHVREPFLTVHCTGPGPRTLTLPDKWSAYNVMTQQWVAQEATHVRFSAVDGSTHTFLVGVREEIEPMLTRNLVDLLRIEQLPERDANVLTGVPNFDVPIMKLDEWMEGTDSDEVADEWFLRPQQIVETPEEEEPERVGRRRRRRRGRGGGTEETANPRREPSGTIVADEDLGMSVMFRKRD